MIKTEKITPDLRFIAESLPSIEFVDGMNIEEARENMPAREFERPERLRVWEEFADSDGVRIRIKFYEPTDRKPGVKLPALCWYHGGGMALGTPESDDWLCERFAIYANCVVASVDYRRTPEYAYPTPLNDAFASLVYLRQNAENLRIMPECIAVAGASAGGNLCAAVCLKARDENGPKICFQMPLFAMFDDRCDTASVASFTESELPFAWNAEANRTAWNWYLKDADRNNPPVYAAPGRADDLTNLPRAYMCVGELDPLRDENMAFAARLAASGVGVEFHMYSGAFHAFENADPPTPIGTRAINEYVNALRSAFWRGLAAEKNND
jgi:acetyl esterase/lipase